MMKWDTENNHWSIQNYFTRVWNGDSLSYQKSKKDSILQINFSPIDLIQSSVKPEEMNYWELNQFVKKLVIQS